MLAEKIRQLAGRMLDNHATAQSVAEHIGPWKNDEGRLERELTPQDKDFQAGCIGIGLGKTDSYVSIGAQQIAYLRLTLAKDTALTADALGRVFGGWGTVPPAPHENPSAIVFYYPDDRALLSVAIFAYLSGPPDEAATRVTSIMLRRDDMAEAFRE